MKRPLCFCVGVYALFAFFTLNFSQTFLITTSLLITISAIVFLLSYFLTKKRAFALIFLLLLFALTAVCKTYFLDLKKLDNARDFDGEYIACEGRVESFSKSADFTVLTVLCSTVNREASDISVSLIIRGAPELDVGSTIKFGGEAEFSEDSYNKGDASFLTVFATFFEVEEPKGFFDYCIFKTRGTIRSTVTDAQSSALLKALIIADKTELSPETKADFQKLGISHILAISGLHLSILVMSVYLILQKYNAGKYLSVAVSVALTLFYMSLTGFSYSIMRAGGMLILYFISRLIRRQSDSITSLFLAGFIIILGDSWSIYSLSLQLSFLSTLGILIFLPPVTRAYDRYFHNTLVKPTKLKFMKKKFFEYLLVSLFSTLSATLVTLPVILLNFNEVSLISPISNLFIVFIAKYFLIFGCVGTTLSLFHIPSALAFFIPDVIAKFMLWCVSLLVKISPPLVGMDMGFVKIGSAVIVVMVLLSFPFCRKVLTLPVTVLSVAVFFAAFNILVSHFTFDHLRASTVWKTGCNTVLVSSKGQVCLTDITLTDSGRVSDILTLLSKRKLTKVDEAVFVIRDKVPEKRISLILSLADIENVTLMLPSGFEDDFISVYSICKERGIGFTPIFASLYSPFDTVEILNFEDSSLLKLEKNSDCMTFVRVYNEDSYVPYFEKCSVMFSDTEYVPFTGEELYVKSSLPVSFWRMTDDRIIRE